MRGRLLVWHTSRGLLRSFQGMETSGINFSLSLCFTIIHQYFPKKNVYPYLASLFLMAPAHGTSLDFLALVPSRTSIKECIYLYNLITAA